MAPRAFCPKSVCFVPKEAEAAVGSSSGDKCLAL